MVNGICLNRYENLCREKSLKVRFENNKAPNIESIIIPAPLEYVSAAKEYFESYDYVEEKHENHVNDQFKSKVILDQKKYSYCGVSFIELL